MAMRPIWAVAISIAAVVAWWELRTLAGGWAGLVFLLSGGPLFLLAPVVMALFLLRRRRLGRWTSILFVAQAAVLVLASLVMPDRSDRDAQAPFAVLLGHEYISDTLAAMLVFVGATLAVAWLVLVPVTALFAWNVEGRRPAEVA